MLHMSCEHACNYTESMRHMQTKSKLTARWPDLPPTSPGPKPLSGSAQAVVLRGAGILSGGRDADAGPVTIYWEPSAVVALHCCDNRFAEGSTTKARDLRKFAQTDPRRPNSLDSLWSESTSAPAPLVAGASISRATTSWLGVTVSATCFPASACSTHLLSM